MKLSDIFRMEVYKNLRDKTNMIIILSIMSLNIVMAVALGHTLNNFDFWGLAFGRGPGPFQIFIIFTSVLLFILALIFLYIYPFMLLRNDYQNGVMSLMIASGVPRKGYYLVKVLTTLLFSLANALLTIVLPVTIAVLIFGDWQTLGTLAVLDMHLWQMPLSFLASYTVLMFSIILLRGKFASIFVFMGFNFANSIILLILTGLTGLLLGIGAVGPGLSTIWSLVLIVVYGWIGLYIISKQNL